MDSAISKVLDTLTPSFLQSLGFLFGGVEGEAQKLNSTLSRIQAHLEDAEDRQIREPSVRLWLRELKDAAYDAEDIVDEVEYQVLRSKIEGAQMKTRKRKLTEIRDQVSDFVSSSFSNLNMGPRIKEIRERLEEIESRSNHLHLKVMFESERLVPGKRHPTSSIIDESIIVGRDTDKEDVVGLLTSEHSSASDSGVQVVPICGMGGLGKTTLAQLAYKDERVVKHFEVKAWVYVSEDFDLMRLTKAIAESVVPGSNPHLTNLDAIQVSIEEALKEKRFLLVLDDVWTEDFDDWHKLRAPLMFGARGSRILVTTRSRRVSSNMGTVPTHFLQGLSDDDCWSLFERRAFVEGNSDAHPDLVKIGKEIVNKCNGLPLAVKTLGGLLCSVVDVVQWEKILKSEIWDLPEARNDILPALRLSYHHLPAHLKRCFAYCACLVHMGSFYGVKGNVIILEWMAQGFIQPKKSTSEQMEDIGREYLADLVSRSLLNCEEYCGSAYYTMHDLTHDLARSVLGADFCEIGDEKSHGNNAEKARYMSDDIIERDSCSNFDDFYCLKSLRTLSLSSTGNIPADLLVTLRHIRTLQLSGHHITQLPESIGDLLQLRYLDLSDTDIERLPKSTTRLYNLQTLILVGCSKLVEVPESIGDLLQLRYLDLSHTEIERLPKSTTRLYNLQTLILVRCRKLVEVPESIGDLLQLRYLALSHMEIERLPKSTTRLYNLQTLKLDGCRKLVEVPESIGELLQLRYLDLSETEIERLPKSTTRLCNLQNLIMNYCSHLVELPSDLSNLVNLRHLCLSTFYDKLQVSIPPRIGTLKGLQTLEYFNVGKEIGRRINELKDLIHLRGCLHISELENVVDVEEAKEAQLKNKQKIDELKLQWKCDDVESRQQGIEEEVLNALQPHTNLKRLRIEGYCGVRFPTWLGDSSFSLQSSRIFDCPELTSLYDMDLPATLDDGLGNSNYSNPTCLPKGLQELTLQDCPKIHSLPEELPTTLSHLAIRNLPNITSLPNGLLRLTSLQSLSIENCPELTSLYDVDLPATLDDGLGNSNYSNPTCLPKGLQNLLLYNCPKIPSLPEELLTTLRFLVIGGCPLLEEKYLVLPEGGNGYRCKISYIPDITYRHYYETQWLLS